MLGARRPWLQLASASLLASAALACNAEIGDRPLEGAGGTSSSNTEQTRPPDELFTGPIESQPAAASRFVRLNHKQYENTVRDLLKVGASPVLASSFVAEPLRSTFDTHGSVLSVSSDLQSDYRRAAETIASTIVENAAVFSSVVPSLTDPNARARAFIEQFGLRAFRRPLAEAEVTRLLGMFNEGATLIGSGDAFNDGVEIVVSYMLQSPHFLYRVELGSEAVGGKIALDAYEVASKLSYALTNSMPDDALFAAAAAGELGTREGVLAHASRLLSQPQVASTIAVFHGQLLKMREFEQISKNTSAFPAFGAGVVDDLKQEGLSFVQHVFDQRLGFEELMTASYTFGNERIAGLYGVPAPAGGAFQRIELDPTQRAGVLTQIGFLAAHAEGQTPNIIMRGVNISHNILCSDLPPPPDMIPTLPDQSPDSTNRERVEELTSDPVCAGCHGVYINPLGFALENLDGVGQYRAQENGQTIDASSSIEIDGELIAFNGPVELMQAIAGSFQAHDCYAKHWVEYLYGRDVDMKDDADRDLVQQGGWLSRSDASIQDLIVNLIATDAFLTRAP
jgi:hypothetical protein